VFIRVHPWLKFLLIFAKKRLPKTPCTSCARVFAVFDPSHLNQMPVFIGLFLPQKYFQQNAFWRTSTITKLKKYD